MSSPTTSQRFKVALYQVGLGDYQSSFTSVIGKIVQANNSKNIAYCQSGKSVVDSFIDMSQFDCNNNYFYKLTPEGYYGRSQALANAFNNQIAEIATLITSNPNKIIHVKTNVNNGISFDDGFDSISNQKIKLLYIISALRNYITTLEIFLIGHSQGGLVNLEVAIEKPTHIKKLISIATPYAPVSVAKNLLKIHYLLKFFNIGNFLEGGTPESTQRYEERANNLTSKNYFKNIKNEWKDLTSKPDLICITGTSGRIFKTKVETVRFGTAYIRMSVTRAYPFDGLVMTSEQRNIDFKHVADITHPSIPCKNEKKHTRYNCAVLGNVECNGCSLPGFDYLSTAVNIAFDVLGGTNPFSNPIINSIFEGVSRSQLTNNDYENFYNIYASDYSHMYIKECDETVSVIRAHTEF